VLSTPELFHNTVPSSNERPTSEISQSGPVSMTVVTGVSTDTSAFTCGASWPGARASVRDQANLKGGEATASAKVASTATQPRRARTNVVVRRTTKLFRMTGCAEEASSLTHVWGEESELASSNLLEVFILRLCVITPTMFFSCHFCSGKSSTNDFCHLMTHYPEIFSKGGNADK
jgi:hypothetical protein